MSVNVQIRHRRLIANDVVEGRIADLVDEPLPRRIPGVDHIPRHFGLAVHPHTPVDEIDEVEVMPLLRPLEVDPAVLESLFPAAAGPTRTQPGPPLSKSPGCRPGSALRRTPGCGSQAPPTRHPRPRANATAAGRLGRLR
jgi:hypothetical protein